VGGFQRKENKEKILILQETFWRGRRRSLGLLWSFKHAEDLLKNRS
jgi:hypothetical protein